MSYKFLLKIESEYGLLQPLSFDHIHNGPDNDVYIVTDGNGYKYILREGKRVGKKVSFELDVLAKLSQANFSSPKPIQTNSGAYSISIDNTQLVLFEYIQGEQIAKILPEHFKKYEELIVFLSDRDSIPDYLTFRTTRSCFEFCARYFMGIEYQPFLILINFHV